MNVVYIKSNFFKIENILDFLENRKFSIIGKSKILHNQKRSFY